MRCFARAFDGGGRIGDGDAQRRMGDAQAERHQRTGAGRRRRTRRRPRRPIARLGLTNSVVVTVELNTI